MTKTMIHDVFDEIERDDLSPKGIYDRLSSTYKAIFNTDCIDYFQVYKDSVYDRVLQIYCFMMYIEDLARLPYIINDRIRIIDSPINHAMRRWNEWLNDFTPGLIYSPYIREFYETSLSFPEAIDSRVFPLTKHSDLAIARTVNRYIATLNEIMHRRDFKERIRKRDMHSRRQFVSSYKFVDSLFRIYRRMIVLRMDFFMDPNSGLDIDSTMENLLMYFSLLKSEMKGHVGVFEHMTGYIARVEYGMQKKHHIHAVIFFNGDYVMHPSRLSRLIAARWEHITRGTGRYFNTHVKYWQYACRAIGMIHRDDREKRKCLTYVLWYITKQDQFLPYKLDEKQRLFFRGELTGKL